LPVLAAVLVVCGTVLIYIFVYRLWWTPQLHETSFPKALSLTEQSIPEKIQQGIRSHVPLGWSPWLFLVFAIVFAGMWQGLVWLRSQGIIEMAKTRQFGSVSLSPHGFAADGWLRYQWDSISIRFPGGAVDIKQPKIVLRLATTAPDYEHIRLNVSFVDVHLDPSAFPHDSTKKEQPWVFPNLNIPLHILAKVDSVHIAVQDAGTWRGTALVLKNAQKRKAELSIAEVIGTQLPRAISSKIVLSWSSKFLEAEASLHSGNDSLYVSGNAPLQQLNDLSGQIRLAAANPRNWISIELPAQVPSVTSVTVQGDFHADLKKKSAEWSHQIHTDLGPVAIFPAGNLTLKGSGEFPGSIRTQALWNGSNGELIDLSVELSKERKISLTGKVENVFVNLASHSLPANGVITQAWATEDSAFVELSSSNGTHVKATLNNWKEPFIALALDVSPSEPWAQEWCNGNLQIAPPAQIRGSFTKGLLSLHVEAVVPYAYKVTADQFSTDLQLNSAGIHFANGHILTRGVSHRFSGEVIWADTNQHFQFAVNQDSTGLARVYGDFDGHISLSVSQLPTQKLPLADTSLLRGIRAMVTGNWEQHFSSRQGNLNLAMETDFKGLPIDVRIKARQGGDSLIIEALEASTGGNSLHGAGLALTDTSGGPLIFQHAEISTVKFSLPAILKAFGDSTLLGADLQGSLIWDRKNGLDGNLSVLNLLFRSIPESQFRVQRLQLHGTGDEAKISARLRLGAEGNWDSEAEINLGHLFSPDRTLNAAIITDHGGICWAQGILDSTLRWKGKLHLEGPWILPSAVGDVTNVSFNADVDANLPLGLAGIKARFALDTAILMTSSINIPFNLRGSLEHSELRVDSITAYGENHSKIQGVLGLDLGKGELQTLTFQSDELHLSYGEIHKMIFYNLEGSASKSKNEIQVDMNLPKLVYQVNDPDLGKIYGRMRANATLHLPLSTDTRFHQSSRLNGRVEVEKLTYHKQLEIVEPKQIRNLFAKFRGTIRNIGKSQTSSKDYKVQKSHTGASTELDIRILDPGRDSLYVRSNIATFPFTLDVQLQGTTDAPLLNGDINATGKGKIGIDKIASFDLQFLRVFWQDNPPSQGQIELSASNELPFCSPDVDGQTEMCPISLSITGPLAQPNPVPTTGCAVEASPAQLYYNIIALGCIPRETSKSVDASAAINRVLSVAITTGINSQFGGEYLGDIGLKYKVLGQQTELHDSNYISIPVKLDRWAKNLSLLIGYTKDVSTIPLYDQSMSAGLKYSMPVLDSNEHLGNHIDPTLDFSGNLVARRYLDAAQQPTLEKNIGVDYSWKFWQYCFFGLGVCTEEK